MHCGTYRNCAMGFSWTVTLLNGHSTNGAEIQCEMSVECKMTWQSKSITVDDLIQQEFASKQLILYSLVSIDNPISAVAWLQIKPELCKRCLQASKYIFVFIKCNRTSQDIDTVLILKKISIPSQAILDCHKKYISASIWDISTKFGLLIDLLKAVTSTDTKPEVVFSRRGRHLEKWIWRHISAVSSSIWTKFGIARCRIMCRFLANGRNRNRK